MLLVSKAFRPYFNFRFELEHLVDGNRQVTQLIDIGRLPNSRQAVANLGHDQGKQEKSSKLSGKCLGRRHTNFRPGTGNETKRTFTHDG